MLHFTNMHKSSIFIHMDFDVTLYFQSKILIYYVSVIYFHAVEIRSFKWDEDTIDHIGNHGVRPDEVEEVAFEDYPYVRKGKRGRRYLYGKTLGGRYLFIVYVLADMGIAQVIMARDMDDKRKKALSKAR